MRTRFLATGCSTTAAPLETLDFVPLPLPQLPPPNYPLFSATFDELPVFGISLEVDKLPIDDSLSIFLSDVLPHLVDGAGFEEPRIDSNKEKHELSTLRRELRFIMARKNTTGWVYPKWGSEKDQRKSSTEVRDGPVFLQFEIPAMDTSLLPPKSGFHSQIGCFDYLSEVPEAEFTTDLLNSKLTPHDPAEVQESLYSVANIRVEYSMEQKGDLLEDVDSVQGKNIKIPVFEVDMESLGILGRINMLDELLSIENIEKQMMQPDGVISNKKEFLGSMESDWINYLFHHSVAILSLQHTSFSSQLDFISIIELSHCQDYSALHCNTDGYSYSSADPILFDEYMFLDLAPYHFSEVLSDSSKKIEADTCENMFGEVMTFRSFSQLIVSHELTLMDDSFKSLPIPIFSDEGSTTSLLTLIEELLAQFDWQSCSASDGLYLDWYFLGGDDCGSAKYSSSCKMLWELDTYNTDVNMSASDSGKLIFDFILSEGHNSIPNAENFDEILNLSRNDDSIFHSSVKADSSSLKNHGDGKRISDDVLLKTSVKNVPVLGKSMSSDLEFFLNPRNHIIERENTPAVKPADTNTVCQVLMSNDDSAAAIATTVVRQKWNVEMHKKSNLDSASAQKECKTKLEELLNTIPVVEPYENEPAEAVNEDGDCNMKSNLDSASAQKECKTKLEELLNTIPVMEPYGNEPVEAVNEDGDCNMVPIQSIPEGLEQNLSCETFGPNIIIIVNTRNFNEEMIISRRSTYQKILDMEQEGAQVVERDIGLPVDIILSSSVCLTWYDCSNIRKKASAPDEAFSCLPLCVESVAASILTSLSFAFCCCILIFEGECNFLCSIMESSDEIYAAAASLGIDIQLFCSYSHEMTEEIILSCINVAAKLTRGVYTKMSDSESLAESFLTAFPSVNPLSAHAILSSDAILGKFLELSNGSKSCALQKYQVPDESIALLSVLSRYGERDDSRSGLTDCSSSLSVTDSEYVQFKLASERKKPKYTHKLYDSGQLTNDLFRMDSQKLISDDKHDLPEFSVSCNAWLSGSTDLFRSEEFSLFFNDKLPQHTHNIDGDMMKSYDADIMKSIDKSSIHDFPLAKSLQISDERENSWMPQIDIDSPRRKPATTLKNNFSRQSSKAPGILQGSSTGEIIDLEDTPAFRETNFVANSSSFSPTLLDDEKNYAATNSRLKKRPSGAANLPIFTNPTDTHAASGTWVSKKDKRKILREETTPYFDTVNRNKMSIMSRKGFVEEDIIEEVPHYSHNQCFQEKGTQSFGGTQLTNALHSTQPQGSPWTIEFLNRIREKSRLRKQSVSYDFSSSFGSSGSTSKVTKRKSPSILEFYKYEGGSTPHKIIEEKRLKRFSQPLNSLKIKKASASCPPSTPVDKRARRTLSFSTNGSGGQSKLVWRDNNHQTSQRRL